LLVTDLDGVDETLPQPPQIRTGNVSNSGDRIIHS